MNIVEILKQVPEDTKLYSPAFGTVKFIEITDVGTIKVQTSLGDKYFYSDGTYARDGEVMLFPSKTNRNWNNFYKFFKNDDIIILTKPIGDYKIPNIAIFKEYNTNNTHNPMCIYCQFNAEGEFMPYEMNVSIDNPTWRKANPEEIANFYKEMHEAGYKFVNGAVVKILQPKFKVGDVITNHKLTFRIDAISNGHYIECHNGIHAYRLPISDQHHWKLKKFDRTTLKPYDKVLVKHFEDGCWIPTLVSHVNSSGVVYTLDSDDGLERVIPFEGHEHLLTSYDDPEPYYITWDDSEN